MGGIILVVNDAIAAVHTRWVFFFSMKQYYGCIVSFILYNEQYCLSNTI